MEEKKTDRNKLVKGLRFLAIALILTFLGPIIIYSAFGNRDKLLFIPILIIGLIVAIGAGYMIFKGIQTIMKAIFND